MRITSVNGIRADCMSPCGIKYLLLIAAFLPIIAVVTPRVGAAAPMEPTENIELRLLPDERSIDRLFLGTDGHVYGVLGHTYESRGRYLRLDTDTRQTSIVERLPEPMVQPVEPLLEGAAVAWIWDQTGRVAYSLNHEGKLVRHTADETREIGQVAGVRIRESGEDPDSYQISEAMVWASDGNLYTAGKEGRIFRYSPDSDELEELSAQLPHVRGRQWWASLDAAVVGPDGLIYGGTHDGYIFAFDPQTEEVHNFGKPIRQHRINGLVFVDGVLLGVGGEEQGLARSFAFDPETRTFTLGGSLLPRGEYAPLGGIVKDEHGNIYLGTRGRLGRLYLLETDADHDS